MSGEVLLRDEFFCKTEIWKRRRCCFVVMELKYTTTGRLVQVGGFLLKERFFRGERDERKENFEAGFDVGVGGVAERKFALLRLC